jgi:hypothetical protein
MRYNLEKVKKIGNVNILTIQGNSTTSSSLRWPENDNTDFSR